MQKVKKILSRQKKNSKKIRKSLKNFKWGLFLVKNMHTIFFVHIVAQYSETNEKSISDFCDLYFLKYKRSKWEKSYPFGFKKLKRYAMFWNGFLSSWVFFFLRCLVFEIWSILYFTYRAKFLSTYSYRHSTVVTSTIVDRDGKFRKKYSIQIWVCPTSYTLESRAITNFFCWKKTFFPIGN